MDISLLEKIVSSPFVWSILCLAVALAYYKRNEIEIDRLRKQNDGREKSIIKLYEDHKKEANAREERLMGHLDRTSETLENINQNMRRLEEEVNMGFEKVWEKFDMTKGEKTNELKD